MAGKVYIVGAGAGDTGLITVRGAEVLSRADVVIYDRLANPRLLDLHAPASAERVYVGKASSNHTLRQDEINALLVKKAQEGRIVVRLHGGDPFVFGRGGEEAVELVRAGVQFEVVPGVTSAVAAPAYAGIPITMRGQNSSFAVVTGHEDPTKGESTVDWGCLAGIGTLVFLMGVANLETIVEHLLGCGRPLTTPVALVRWGTWSRQETLVGTLGDIVAKVRQADFHPPAVTIVGSVVGMREQLRWWDTKPLSGKRVLVTRSREQASVLSELLKEQGADPIEAPVIEIAPPLTFDEMDEALRRLDSYDWVVFTSVNGVRAVVDRLLSVGSDVRAFGRARLAAIGPATAEELRRCHLRVDLVPEEYVAEAAVAALTETGIVSKKILLPRADLARDVLRVDLEKAGAMVDGVVAYRTVPATTSLVKVAGDLEAGRIDVVTLASSSTAQNLVAGLGERAMQLLSKPLIACIGPITAETARRIGLRVDVVATEYTIPGLVEAITAKLTARARDNSPTAT